MAYTDLPVQQPTSSGITPTYTAAPAAGSKFSNDGRVMLIVKNASGGAIVVTIVTPRTVDGLAIADKTISVPATTGEKWATFDPNVYNQPDGAADAGYVYVDYAAVTSLTVAAVRI